MIEENSNIDILTDIDDERWLELHTYDEWPLIIHEIITKVMNHLEISAKLEISILLTNDKEIAILNKNYRNKDKPTNVLSFPNLSLEEIQNLHKQSPYPIMLGDIALAFETVLSEAKIENKLFLHHFYHLVVHGTLHLLGYDHEKDVDAERMQEKEIAILKTLNVTDPYQPL